MNAGLPEEAAPRRDDDAERCRTLRALFEAAVEQPVAMRDHWLDVHVGDGALRAAVQRLLDADAAPGQLETPVNELADRIGDDPALSAQDLIGQRIGGFRLLRSLGQGGMGSVFLGERDGADFAQRAAIKLLRRGLLTPVEQTMFRRERKALARLSHPNITHLIDGGITDRGIPFLVMEYVDGEPITTYAVARKLGLRGRLALFLVVCRAAAAAHRNLIVHRDIKPSNILVTASGEAKLLDFGIAKLLDDDDDPAHRTQVAALTRGYAAPEQYAGGPVSTATDVYSLGVLLHELLLGERPDEPTMRASSRVPHLRTDPAALPVPAPALRSALRGDLDNILLKAMAAEPEQRYGSAAELADDIERHLDARPVNAHPPSAWYRALKFAQRHRGGVALSLAFALALVASLGATVWQARVARDHAANALRQASRATEIQHFLEALFDPYSEGTSVSRAPTLPELLQRGRARIDERHPDDPQVRADLLAMFARIEDGVGETADNRALAEAAWRANVQAYGEQDARSLEARSLYARVLRKLGDYPAALAEYEAVRSIMQARGIGGQDYARLLDATSWVLMEQGIDPQRAIALKREALELREADPDASTDDLGTGYNNLGAAYQYAEDYPQALVWYRKALALDRASSGDSLATATSLMNVGMVQTQAGSWREGAASLGEARAMFARIPLDRHPTLVSLLIRLCGVQADLELSQATATCEEAVSMAREVHGATHAKYAMALTRAASARVAAGDDAAAANAFAQARTVLAASRAEARREIGIIDSAQARSWWLHGDFASLREAMLRWLEQHPTPGGRPVALALAALACRHSPAAGCDPTLVEQAERQLGAAGGAGTPNLLLAQLALAEIALAEGRPEAAIVAVEQVLGDHGQELHPQHSLRAQAWLTLAALRAKRGDAEPALADAARGQVALQGLPPSHSLHRHQALLEDVPRAQ